MKILLVDDSKPLLLINKALLQKEGYEVVTAHDGQEAWDILQKQSIRYVISDWMMPVMDGMSLCKKIREHTFENYIYFILLTAKDDDHSLVEGYKIGVDDYISKPVKIDELTARMQSGRRVIELEDRMLEQNKQLKDFEVHIKSQLDLAASTLVSTLPKPAVIDGYRFEWLFNPAEYLGGDIFSFTSFDDDHLLFFQIDVSGHGISSALASLMINSILLQNRSIYYVDGKLAMPSLIVEKLNDALELFDESMIYCTLVLGWIQKSTGRAVLTQAAHPMPLIISKNGAIRMVGKGGPPVGLMPGSKYEDAEFQLESGERLIIYTDGVTDILDEKSNKLFSEELLQQFLLEHKERDLAEILKLLEKEILSLTKGIPQDDVSLLALEKQ